MIKLPSNLEPVLSRFFLFALLFIIVTGVTGPWVVSSRLLYPFYFFIYGNLGKMVLISLIIFGLLIRKQFRKLETLPLAKTNIYVILFSFALIPLFFILGNNLLQYQTPIQNIPLFFTTHLDLIAIPGILLLGIFGDKFLIGLVKEFKNEILICLGISIAYDIIIFQVWKLWPVFSGGVLNSVKYLLSLTSQDVQFFLPRTLLVNNFAVSIEKACSGLDSIFLFSSLYLLIAILDYKKFNKIKLSGMFFPSIMGLYLVNILRVYFLILIGAYLSPALALNLFHTYAGMILFIIYFYFFWKGIYKWLIK